MAFLFRGHQNNIACDWTIRGRDWSNSYERHGPRDSGEYGSPVTYCSITDFETPDVARLYCYLELVHRGKRSPVVIFLGGQFHS